ncbi:MAG: Uma2 family endonuclease [Chloroflexota bacterium]|nr:Uma2 family endonuclease [Chloroflexota bacterium]
MVAEPRRQRITVDNYLKIDRTSDKRHEYIDGYAYAIAGRTVAHMRIAANMFMLLDEQLGEQGPCHAYSSDIRVQLSQARYVYLDVTISCDVADWREKGEIVRSPRLVVEVLSPTTELYDRGKKFTYYQEYTSVQEYALIGSQRQVVEVFRRTGKKWTYQRYGPAHTIELESLDIQLPISAIYARVRVPIEDDEYGR